MDPAIEAILDQHGISPKFRPAFYQFTEDGSMANAEFVTRMNVCTNYKAACEEILELLSRPLKLSSSQQFVSLDPENL